MDSTRSSKEFPGFNHLYELRGSSGNGFRVDLESDGDPLPIVRGEAEPKAPLVGRWTMGHRSAHDIIWTTWAIPIIVCKRVIDIFTANNFTGWRTYDVEIYAKGGSRVPDFFGLSVVGRCGPFDNTRCERVMVQLPGTVRATLKYKGTYFDEGSWDGSDLFMSSQPWTGVVMVTERVQKALTGAKPKIRDLRFESLDSTLADAILFKDRTSAEKPTERGAP